MTVKRAKIRRITLGMKQKRLAEKVGLDPARLCRWENNQNTLPLETELRIEEALSEAEAQATEALR